MGRRKLSTADEKRLARVRAGEPMHPSNMRGLVRRGLVRKLVNGPRFERTGLDGKVSCFCMFELVKSSEE